MAKGGMGRTVLWIVAGVFLFLPALAAMGPGLLRGAVTANAPAAGQLTCHYPVDHVCPANGNKLEEQRQQQTTPTTMAARVPYPAPNGPVRPLPSQAQPQAPAIGSGSNLPKIGEAPSGGILGKIPEIGPVIEGGLKAIGPAVAP